MVKKDILKEGIGVVGTILPAFSGFLLNVAPPEVSSARFPVGTASLILLFVYLLIRVMLYYNWAPKKRLVTAAVISFLIFLASFAFYYRSFQESVYRHGGGTLFVKGACLTKHAAIVKEALAKEMDPVTDQRLVAEFGNPGNDVTVLEKVWTRESIEKAREQLIIVYIILVTSVGSAFISLYLLFSSVSPRRTPNDKLTDHAPEPDRTGQNT